MTIYIFMAMALCAFLFLATVWVWAACVLASSADAVNDIAAARMQADMAEQQAELLAAQLAAMMPPEVSE